MDFTTPLILLGVLLVVTLMIVGFDMIFGNNAARAVIVNGKKEIPVTSDDTLLNILSSQKIFIPSACGGKSHVWLLQVHRHRRWW